MHHSRNANAPHCGQRLATLGQHIRSQCRVGSLHTLPDFLQRVGPDAVFQPVLPGKIALGHRLAGIAHKHSFDAGGTQLDAERALLKSIIGILLDKIKDGLYHKTILMFGKERTHGNRFQ